jgi:subtilisin
MNGTRLRAAAWAGLAAAIVLVSVARPALAQGGGDFIVTFRVGVPAAARGNAAAAAGGALRRSFRGVNAAVIRVPNARAQAALRAHPSVLSVVPDRAVVAFPAPQQAQSKSKGKPTGGPGNGRGGGGGDGGGGDGGDGGTPPPPPTLTPSSPQVLQPGVTRVRIPTAGSNGDGVGVAILDTGVELAHPDLTGTVDAFSAWGGSCQDDGGHGTHVAGIVAARDNTIDVVGVAPSAVLYCVKVLNSAGSGSDGTVMAGLDWVLDQHATVQPHIRVVNMSLGRPGTAGDNPALHDLIVKLEAAGVVVVAAAGNSANGDVSQLVPAAYAEVIAVASTTARDGTNQCAGLPAPIAADTASSFTTDGLGVTVSAPGEEAEDVNSSCGIHSVGVLSTRMGGGTTRMSGTSMAAPHVAGVMARYFQLNPLYTVANVRQYVQADAARAGVAPLNSPTSSYTFDGEREGIAQAP